MISRQKIEVDCLKLKTSSPAATERLGRLLAGFFTANSVVSLSGDLGAGKTALTRGIASGLGCQGQVASPTFMLLMEHPARPGGLALYHFDVYRLLDTGGDQAFIELGLDEYFTAGGVSVLEWGEALSDLLPAASLAISLHRTEEAEEIRLIELCWPGQPEKLAALAEQIRQEEEGMNNVDSGL